MLGAGPDMEASFGTPDGRRSSFHLGSVTFADLASFREAAYRLLSGIFLYPDSESVAAVGPPPNTSDDEILDQLAFSAEWRRLLLTLSALKAADLPRLESRYVALFVTARDTVPCLPYESAYRGQPGQDSAWVMTDLEREYATDGLSLSPDLKESPDHVALEMEYMAVLCGRESQAWREERQEQGMKLLKKETRFLDRHLGVWLPRFVQTLAAAEGGLYATAGAAAEAFVTHDRDLVKLLRGALSEPNAVGEGSP